MIGYRTLKDTSNSAKHNLKKHTINYQYSKMEREKADMTNFRRKPYSVKARNHNGKEQYAEKGNVIQ